MLRTATLALLFTALTANAQQNVILEIDHLLGGAPYSTAIMATNNLSEDFDVYRLRYYISEIALIHDGGQVTPITDTWVLVNVSSTTTVDLGSHNITSLEAVEFGIGVDPAVNHLDPSLYPVDHPLAPQSPAMHWGWASGYRFIAMEGRSGSGLSQSYEIHGLGDGNYLKQTIPTAGLSSGNDLIVKLNAEYEKALWAISVAAGPIVHSETGIAADLIANFDERVFTSVEGNGPVGVSELNNDQLQIYPNPTTDRVRISSNGLVGTSEVRVHDALGKLVHSAPFSNATFLEVELPTTGVYQVSVLQGGQVIAARTVVKQ